VLLRQLSDLELKRLELLQKRKDTHPDVVTINEQINKIKAQLTDYNQNTIIAYQIIINSLREKQSRLLSLIQKYSGRIESLPAAESQLAELIRQKEVYAKMFSLLLDKREEMRMAELSKLQDIIVVDPAQKPLKPISPRKGLNVMLALLAGCMLGLTAVFIAEHFEKKLTTLDDVEKLFRVAVMGVLPVYDSQLREQVRNSKSIEERAVVLMKEQFTFKEIYRLLRTKLGNMPGSKIIMLTSCEENTGKTTVISNLAVSIAKMGKKVLVLDCDLRKGKIGKFFDLPEDAPGIIDYLSNNQKRLEVYNNFSFLTRPTLAIVPNGGYTDDSSELLSTIAVKSMLEDFQKTYDYILIDTPPITKVSDVLILGDLVKDIILIIRPFLTYKEAIRGALEEIRQAGLNLQGVVVNGFNLGKSAYYYRYGHGYNYRTISDT
jgi:capsular exopolysaccharide synthesis family protein